MNNLKEFLDEKYYLYNTTDFVETDPIQVPREFVEKENIEISAFLAATIAWGQRKTIINNAYKLMNWMDNNPLDFLMNAQDKDYKVFLDFKHRTFNGEDAVFFIKSLANIYKNHGGLEAVFSHGETLRDGLINARKVFFSIDHPATSNRQFSNIEKKSAAKRLNMYLRWMVRKDTRGVEFGIWDGIKPSELFLPLDVHTASVGRKLNLLTRKQNDWQAVEEITANLRSFDAEDPIKYDFALFGLGAFENF